MDDLEPITDINGYERRLGLNTPDTGMLKAFREMPGAVAEWTDSQIREVITNPERIAARKMFGPDWIADQLQFGSCAGWATVACEDRARWLSGIHDGLKLAGNYIYAWVNGGRDNGSQLSDTLNAIGEHGAPPKSMLAANLIYRSQMPRGTDEIAAAHKALIAYPVKTIRGLKTALARNMPCVVAVHAGRNFQLLDSRGVAGVDNGRGNHAICAQDLVIIDGELAYDIANSWKLGYGANGFAYLREESFVQTFPYHTFWALASPEETDR